MVELDSVGMKGGAGLALGATTAALLKFLKEVLKIFALIQVGILSFLELSGVITVNWSKLWDSITSLGGLVGDAATSAFDALMEMGTFGAGFTAGFALVWFRGGKKTE
tara:strand:+ start:3391 stop:3714 length:324 start_codon:yes stop_codon:yes gene_type:complete